MLVGGFIVYKLLLADLMDEVWDNRAELIIVNAGHVERLPLSNIMNVNYSGLTNPKRVTLSLRQMGRWGEKLSFIPPMSFSLFALFSNPVVDGLIRRIDAARRLSSTAAADGEIGKIS